MNRRRFMAILAGILPVSALAQFISRQEAQQEDHGSYIHGSWGRAWDICDTDGRVLYGNVVRNVYDFTYRRPYDPAFCMTEEHVVQMGWVAKLRVPLT